MLNKKTLVLAFLMLSTMFGWAQNVGIKTNLISDAATSPNLGLEFRMAPKWTFDLSGQVNMWNIHERRWRHWMVQPEARVWFCEAFQGSFFAIHAIGGQYNIGNLGNLHGLLDHLDFLGSNFSNLKDHRYTGWGVGSGIAYGYAWMLGKHWNLEAEIGVGYIYTWFDRYSSISSRNKDGSGHHNYFGPTKLSLAIEYLF